MSCSSCCCCCCNDHKREVVKKVESNECLCCYADELNLKKLKSTNQELKDLIGRLDKLSDSVGSSYKAKKCHNVCNCEKIYYDECNLCRSCKETITKQYQYDLVICDDCERMIRLSKELETKKSKKDPKIYPLTKYPSGKEFRCNKCEKCVHEMRSRSRSRSRSRRSYSRSISPDSSRGATPIWNGGPWTSYYPWTNWKLKESKH